MTNERRQDIFLVAMVASVAIHIGLMFWVKPQVMTHVDQRRPKPRHAPARVVEAPIIEAPTAVDFFRDEEAKKAAPTATGVADAPSADGKTAIDSAAAELSAPSIPVMAVKVETPVTDEIASDPSPVPMPSTFAVRLPAAVESTAEEKPAFLAHPGGEITLVKAAEPPPAPEASAPPAAAPRAVIRSIGAEDGEGGGTEAHVVPSEVMSEVDEKFVESEKKAVRRLIDVDNALDMTRAVAVSLERETAGGWTYFRVRFVPRTNLPAVPKDFVVLLDASGSIGFDRLASCRKAAKRILRSCTNTGDRFNLVAFRDRFSYAFRSWRECDAAGFAAGDKWLANLAAHGRTDVFSTIRSVLTLPRDPKRPLIAIVVTDGDANTGVSETKDILAKFSALNDGLISVYMYGVRSSANRELIDCLTRSNRGESFIYENWAMWNAGEGLEGLCERFRDPLITDLRIVFAAPLRAEAYPTALKNLYRGNSVELVGRLPGAPVSLDFSLKGLAGDHAYEGYFRLPFASAAANPKLSAMFAREAELSRY